MLPTMLVINEDRDMADFIAGLFSGGYNVRIVSDLKCPQEKLAEAQPQIIICGTVSLNTAMIGLIRSIRETKQLMQDGIATALFDGMTDGVSEVQLAPLALLLLVALDHARLVADAAGNDLGCSAGRSRGCPRALRRVWRRTACRPARTIPPRRWRKPRWRTKSAAGTASPSLCRGPSAAAN